MGVQLSTCKQELQLEFSWSLARVWGVVGRLQAHVPWISKCVVVNLWLSSVVCFKPVFESIIDCHFPKGVYWEFSRSIGRSSYNIGSSFGLYRVFSKKTIWVRKTVRQYLGNGNFDYDICLKLFDFAWFSSMWMCFSTYFNTYDFLLSLHIMT